MTLSRQHIKFHRNQTAVTNYNIAQTRADNNTHTQHTCTHLEQKRINLLTDVGVGEGLAIIIRGVQQNAQEISPVTPLLSCRQRLNVHVSATNECKRQSVHTAPAHTRYAGTYPALQLSLSLTDHRVTLSMQYLQRCV